jgi:hypothetical protein
MQTFAIAALEGLDEADKQIMDRDGEIEAYKELLDQADVAIKSRDELINKLRSKEEGYIRKIEETEIKQPDEKFVDKMNNSQLTLIGSNKYAENRAKIVEQIKNKKLEILRNRHNIALRFKAVNID